ncbi:hypothetical protein CIK76_07820 [Glutamicibacter sp. BW80]|uniref:thiolase family protein n=1 Tax=Glutamicibacter sp. AOP33-2CA-4 TaxID=3457690 RepID=UPI000BB94586|nr:hypothetical protein CIK76_07820 [Glutamicibacter sp. BW80]
MRYSNSSSTNNIRTEKAALAMNEALIIAARRTPVVRSNKEFARLGADQLLGKVFDALLEDTGISPADVDHVFAGNAAGPGGNIARVATQVSRLPDSVPATTLDAQCASALEAIAAAARMVRCGEARAVIAGGVESVSTAPWRMEKNGDPASPPRIYSRARFTPHPQADPEMGVAAENIAAQFQISRTAQDEFALRSHQRAVQAQQAGRFNQEIVPIGTPSGVVQSDTCPREGLSAKKLASLRPAFVPGGTVTAGNSCPINDGAAAVLVVDAEHYARLDARFALRYLGTGTGACDPQILGMAAVPAYQKLAQLLGVDRLGKAELIEFNEAFAVQALACLAELGIGASTVNRDGGALALGHPYGASGALLATRLFWQARATARGDELCLALMAAAGGTGTAMAFESVYTQPD